MKVFRTWITLKNGIRLYARDYGKKAFCFETDKGNPYQNEVDRSKNDPSKTQGEN